MPPLHSPKVGAIVPSVSMKACSRKPAGWACQTRWRVALSASSSASMAPWSKRRVKSPLVVGSGMRSRAQAVQKGFVVAAQRGVFEPLAAQQGVVGQIEHRNRFRGRASGV
jgi:hypothetical protein